MQCDEAGGLINALIDGELDAVHARDVEAHIAQCPRCAALRDDYCVMHEGLSSGAMKLSASDRPRTAAFQRAARGCRRNCKDTRDCAAGASDESPRCAQGICPRRHGCGARRFGSSRRDNAG